MSRQKIKTTWNLGLLYEGNNDPQIERDIKHIERACVTFEKKYRGKGFTKTPQKLAQALADWEKLGKAFKGSKPIWYFQLKSSLDSGDDTVRALQTRYEQRMTTAKNRTMFFLLDVGRIPKSKQKLFLSHETLQPHRYRLERIFRRAEHHLSEGEEQLDNLLSQTSYSMWVDGNQKILGEIRIPWKGEQLPLSKAGGILPELPDRDRTELGKRVRDARKDNSKFAEAEINAVYTYKKIMDEREGYEKPYSQTVLNHEVSEKAVEKLVETVTQHFKISKRFYKLHAKLLGKKKLLVSDLYVPIDKIKTKFSFKDSVDIIGDAFREVDPQYKRILRSFVENGQIDVYPRGGKNGGAYCWGNRKPHTFVFLNHVDNAHSVSTLAHEMGHAIHSELSRTQPLRYESYTTATAETASTFFEQVANDAINENLSDAERVTWLHNKILNDVMTIFRQIACFNFEVELNERIRVEGYVSKEEIAKLMKKHLRSYLGDSVDVTDDDGYSFVSWSHIRRFFYVYSYAWGQLISKTLFEYWKEDASFAKKIEQFLRAGGSMSPEDIFRSIGVDVRAPGFFEKGLEAIERDIDTLEQLTAKKTQSKAKNRKPKK